jgi:hypothetical protein
MRTCRVLPAAVLALALAVPAARAADPTDNPIASFYWGPEGYPAWTDSVNWSNVINMKADAASKDCYDSFKKAANKLAREGGGVLYYPKGDYHFSTHKRGRALELPPGVVIRGEAPDKEKSLARDGTLQLETRFHFESRQRGKLTVPDDWAFITVDIPEGRSVKDVGHIGIAWVHISGATVAFGPDIELGKTWGQTNGMWPVSFKVKDGPAKHEPTGTHPIDALLTGSKKYRGGARGRFVFGCVLQDAAVLDDFSDPGYGTNGCHTSRYCARVVVYGSRVLVANNRLSESKRPLLRYTQKVKGGGEREVTFDYGKTIGIDINKELLTYARQDGTCPGYFEEGVVVRDNWVYNHGHTGYNISGKWVSITNNHNERAVLRLNELTLDGWETNPPDMDYRSRAFDLAGRCVWVHDNSYNNTGSSPMRDAEGIVCRPAGGTQLYSWAITHNVHTLGNGGPGSIGGLDADCHGLLVGWNQTAGWVGDLTKRLDAMTDCAFVGNRLDRPMPKAKIPPQGPLTPATKVTADVRDDAPDAVRITWEASSDYAAGFKVQRRIGGGGWHTIAYRPPRPQGDGENPAEWVDFTAPPGRELTYRVVSLGISDNDKMVSRTTEALVLAPPR